MASMLAGLMPISGNAARMIQQSRLAPHFEVAGTHCCHQGGHAAIHLDVFDASAVDVSGLNISAAAVQSCC